jgi:hypothetical protein
LINRQIDVDAAGQVPTFGHAHERYSVSGALLGEVFGTKPAAQPWIVLRLPGQRAENCPASDLVRNSAQLCR